jgi:hypothetical protein
MNAVAQNLISGGGWYAVIEGHVSDNAGLGYRAAAEEDRGKLLYAPVIAWERHTDEQGVSQMRAWLSGQTPIASDRFSDECQTYFINHFAPEKPEHARLFTWA